MTIPTRMLEWDEFHELMKLEGDVLPLFTLTAHPFNPPTVDGQIEYEPVGVNVLLVNVSEPCLYRDPKANMGFVLLNGYDPDSTFTYENFQDCHIVKDAWFYRLTPSYWDEDDPGDELDEAIYCFNHGEIPEWKEPGD